MKTKVTIYDGDESNEKKPFFIVDATGQTVEDGFKTRKEALQYIADNQYLYVELLNVRS